MAIAVVSWVSRTKNFLLREATQRKLSGVAGMDWTGKLEGGSKDGNAKCESSGWVPHPRSGIYYPKGHERVMNDVPEGAANFDRTFWLRNVDSVEKTAHDESVSHYDRMLHVYS